MIYVETNGVIFRTGHNRYLMPFTCDSQKDTNYSSFFHITRLPKHFYYTGWLSVLSTIIDDDTFYVRTSPDVPYDPGVISVDRL